MQFKSFVEDTHREFFDKVSEIREEQEKLQRLRSLVRGPRKDLKARMLEVSREEVERKRMPDERGRHKQAMLEAYDQQEARIFAEYHKSLTRTLRGKLFIPLSADDVILFETTPRTESKESLCTTKPSFEYDELPE
ncbi:hypothetical protein YC2023_019925 [Brassica napus]